MTNFASVAPVCLVVNQSCSPSTPRSPLAGERVFNPNTRDSPSRIRVFRQYPVRTSLKRGSQNEGVPESDSCLVFNIGKSI